MKSKLIMLACLVLVMGCNDDESTSRVYQFFPAVATEGSTVVIMGKNFDPQSENNIVRINGLEAEVLHAIPSHLYIKVPAGASTGPITISTGKGNVKSTTDLEIVEGNGTWTQKSDFPGGYRNHPIGFSHEGFGYVGFGQNDDHENINDFWKYNPVSNTWTSLPAPELELPPDNSSFEASGSFVTGDDAFVVFTAIPWSSRVVMKYSFANNEWTEFEDAASNNWSDWPNGVRATETNGIIAFASFNGNVGAKTLSVYNAAINEWSASSTFPGNASAYNPAIMGSQIFFWETLGPPNPILWIYTSSTNTWSSQVVTNYQGSVTEFPSTFSLDGALYYVGGTVRLLPLSGDIGVGDGYTYNPSTKQWGTLAVSPLNGIGISFTIGAKAYVAFGYSGTSGETNAHVYEFTP